MEKTLYDNYVLLLRHDLLPALGCTEPIAVAYCAAVARRVLGRMPDRAELRCSGNIIKNVKGVAVPNSGGMKGIEAAAALGITGGDASRRLEVLQAVTEDSRQAAAAFLRAGKCVTALQEGEENLYILCRLYAGEDSVEVELKTLHDHISRVVKNGETVFSQPDVVSAESGDKSLLALDSIYEFACTCDLDDVRDILEQQISCNSSLAEEGLRGDWGVNAGSKYLRLGDDPRIEAAAMAAAGSDARMGGCSLPAVINSGSGNQGITLTMPILVYGRRSGADHDKILRALVLANLISIHQKRFIGNLSCYCGATSAGTAAACDVAFLEDAPKEVIYNTIVNSVSTIGGMICDGAKPSCATKIRTAVDNALFAYDLAKAGDTFKDGEGIVGGSAEETIRNIGRVGRVGMAPTDIEVLNVMIGN